MKNKSIFISDQVTDTQRINAQEVLAPNLEKKLLVYVEGKFDKKIIQSINLGSVTVQIASQMVDNNEVGGKRTVIQKVNEQNNTIGIVDMDYDFFSSEISGNPRIIDSNPFCVLFSLFYDKIDFNKVFSTVRLRFDQYNDCLKYRQKTPDIDFNLNKIEVLFREGTWNRLFRSMQFKKREKGLKYSKMKISWDTLSNNFQSIELGINNFELENDFKKYLGFRKKYESKLKKCGINDHSIEDSVTSLIWSEYRNSKIYDYSWNLRGGKNKPGKITKWIESEIFSQIEKLDREVIIGKLRPISAFISKHADEFERLKKMRSELNQCEGITKKGVRCKREFKRMGSFCWQHDS